MNKLELMEKVSKLIEEYENDNDIIMGAFLTFIDKEGKTWPAEGQKESDTSVYEWNGERFDELDKNIGVVKMYV